MSAKSQQIARKAREEWFSHYAVVGDRTEANQILDKIILSAIERAIQLDFVCGTCGASATHPQPQRSEWEEWTPHWERVGDIDYYIPEATCNKHNAALTAEREKVENLHNILGKKRVEIKQLKQDCLGSDKIIAQFLDQLAAERQRRRQAERIYTRCPACGNDTLTNNEGHLLCTWHVCPNPTAIENLSQQLLSALTKVKSQTRRGEEGK